MPPIVEPAKRSAGSQRRQRWACRRVRLVIGEHECLQSLRRHEAVKRGSCTRKRRKPRLPDLYEQTAS